MDKLDRFEFYKEQYFKEEDKKNEINNSLSVPIGIISGLVATLFYFGTTFDFKLNLWNSIIFSAVTLTSVIFLIISVFHLIKAYTNFHSGYGYDFLADTGDLEKYHKGLKDYYKANPALTDTTDEEFKDAIINDMVKVTDKNQKNNKQKSYHRYVCQTHLITAFFILCFDLFPFGYNFADKQDKKETYSVEIVNQQEPKVNSQENINFVDSSKFQHQSLLNDTGKKVEKPTSAPTQTIK